MQEFLTILISKEASAGIWAVIGALIALLGIFANNLYQNARSKKEREHQLIRDSYLGAIEYIAHQTHKIMSAARDGEIKITDKDVAVSTYFYKLFLVGSPKVIESFSKLTTTSFNSTNKVNALLLDYQIHTSNVRICQQEIDSSLESMKMINAAKQQYIDKKLHDPKLLSSFEERFKEAIAKYDENEQKKDNSFNLSHATRMELTRECLEAMNSISPRIYETISSMRDDLDRKLSRKDAKRIEMTCRQMETNVQEKVSEEIETIKEKIADLQKSLS